MKVKTARLVPTLLDTPACVARQFRLIGSGIALLLALLGTARPCVAQVSANSSLPTDLSYNTETTWMLPSLPNLSATAAHIPQNFSQGEAIFQLYLARAFSLEDPLLKLIILSPQKQHQLDLYCRSVQIT